MDPMSAITAGLSAVTSGLNMLSGIFDAVGSFAGLADKFFNALSGLIQEPQQTQAQQVTDQSTQDMPQAQRDFFSGVNVNVFGDGNPSSNPLPLAA